MVVQHNLTAMNSNRMLNVTTKSQAKSTEKLSSGYKINRAADDAAGLSISEKMRKQIRGLTQASSNAQDGISSVQTAEGALTEVHDMLQRMNELAVKAANGTNSKDDRDYIQAEVDQLVTEIDRVSTTTKFNETYLLKGVDADGKVGGLKYTEAEKIEVDGVALTAGTFAEDGAGTIGTTTATDQDTYTNTTHTNTNYDAEQIQVGDITYVLVESTTAAAAGSYMSAEEVAKAITAGETDTKAFTSMDELVKAIKKDNAGDIKSISFEDDTTGALHDIKAIAFADKNAALDLSLHVGADSGNDNKISLSIEMMSARGIGINGLRVDGEDDENATAAIDFIATAIQKVSSQRSALGAIQNRLEHTIANLDNVVENTTSAESAIRDTDMATEMVRYSNNNILAQAGQAMLAQANQSNQGVLSLLQG